ncbi:hypothetical protein E3Q19_00694 [Wallemia mellicola]|nr:hypothetical protein E3Q19_00694 [Wallemia mellicola]
MFIGLIGLDIEERGFTAIDLKGDLDDLPQEVVDMKMLTFGDLMDYVTSHWQDNFVTATLPYGNTECLDLFMRRPFTLLVGLEARIERTIKSCVNRFADLFDGMDISTMFDLGYGIIRPTMSKAQLNIYNPYKTEEEFLELLRTINIEDTERIRPNWDTYFMELADLASQRSNCMKRRVGAVLTEEKRVVATGYNGTPRGLKNCTEGGCTRCNSGVEQGFAECLCLHAEENALLEAGRSRIGSNAVLYCDTCPCLGCAIKIIQTGIKEVVYNQAYRVDDKTYTLFKSSGVILRKYSNDHKIMF